MGFLKRKRMHRAAGCVRDILATTITITGKLSTGNTPFVLFALYPSPEINVHHAHHIIYLNIERYTQFICGG